MIRLAALTLNIILGPTLFGLPPAEDLAIVRARYEKECGGTSTPACKKMQWQLEAALYGMLRANGAVFDADILDVALSAEMPQLQAYALRRMQQMQPFPANQLPRVVALLDSPYAMVRVPALEVLVDKDARYGRYTERSVDYRRASPIPDQPPDATALGAPVYKGANYRAFVSDEQYAWFTTSDPPDRAAGFFATAGRKARTADELRAERDARRKTVSDSAAIMKLMMQAQAQGKSPEEIQAMMMNAATGSAPVNLDAFEKDGMVAPRFVELGPEGERLVAIFRDEVLGATAIVYTLPAPTAALRAARAKMSPERQTEEALKDIQRQQIFVLPMIEP